jgi:hypothetical protein
MHADGAHLRARRLAAQHPRHLGVEPLLHLPLHEELVDDLVRTLGAGGLTQPLHGLPQRRQPRRRAASALARVRVLYAHCGAALAQCDLVLG